MSIDIFLTLSLIIYIIIMELSLTRIVAFIACAFHTLPFGINWIE